MNPLDFMVALDVLSLGTLVFLIGKVREEK